MSALLGIHVFGGKQGESIAVELPNSEWGLIDCYVSDLTNWTEAPVNKFLAQKGVAKLNFLCLTHPHEDHFRGMSKWAENTSRFWLYGGLSNKELYSYSIVPLLAEQALFPEYTKRITESLADLRKTIDSGFKSEFKLTVLGLPLQDIQCEGKTDLKISAIGTTPREALEYGKYLSSCFTPKGAEVVLNEKIKNVNHNKISSGLMLEWGKIKIILGGDMEKGSWVEVENAVPDLACDLVKISHHGSENGFTTTLWSKFSPAKRASSVFTCFSKQQLPRKAALAHILENSSSLFTTSAAACNEGLEVQAERQQTAQEKKRELDKIYKDFELAAVLGSSLEEVSVEDPAYDGRCSFYFSSEGFIRSELYGNAAKITVKEIEHADGGGI